MNAIPPARGRTRSIFALDCFGRMDILVNNAVVQRVAPVATPLDERWEEVLALNLSAAFCMTAAVLPGMRARRWERTVNVASVHGLIASAQGGLRRCQANASSVRALIHE